MRSTILVQAALALLFSGPLFGQEYTFIPIDVSCDGAATACPAGLAPGSVARQTSARGINARGDIVGFYVDTAGAQHGFLLADGQYTTIDFPLAGVRSTVANGINAQGEIVGQYLLPVSNDPNIGNDSPLYCPKDLPNGPDPACIKGFHLRHGVFTTIMYVGHPGAIPQRITEDGDIYGCLHDHNLTDTMFGAAWTRSFGSHGSVVVTSRFSLVPDGGELGGAMAYPMSMNNGGTPGGAHTIVGFFSDMAGQQHGYLVQNGMFTPYDPNLEDPAKAVNLTAIWDVSPNGLFVGTYRMSGEPGPKRHGFLQASQDGAAPSTLDVAYSDAFGNLVQAFATTVFGVNPAGVVVGNYTLSATGTPHGFIGIPPRE